MDFYSHFAKDITPFITAAFEGYQINDENIKTAIKNSKTMGF